MKNTVSDGMGRTCSIPLEGKVPRLLLGAISSTSCDMPQVSITPGPGVVLTSATHPALQPLDLAMRLDRRVCDADRGPCISPVWAFRRLLSRPAPWTPPLLRCTALGGAVNCTQGKNLGNHSAVGVP